MVVESAELGWEQLKNGALLDAAEASGFQVMVTSDRNIRFQQNLGGRKIAVVVLPSGRWPLVQAQVAEIVNAVDSASPGSYTQILLHPAL